MGPGGDRPAVSGGAATWAAPHDRQDVSAFYRIVVVLLVILCLAAFLDGVAVLARAKSGLAGIIIGVAWFLRLISHFDLRW